MIWFLCSVFYFCAPNAVIAKNRYRGNILWLSWQPEFFSSPRRGRSRSGIFNGYLPVISALELLAYWAILSSLVVVFVADLRWYFIPDGAIAAGIFGAAVLTIARFFESDFIFHRFDWNIIFNPLLSGLFAALFFLAIFLFSRGKWIGFGDVKYALLMGLALGFPETLLALFLANFFGAIIGLGLIAVRRKKMSSEIPFGPFLVGGTLVALFFSGSILNWYLSIGMHN